MQTSIFIKKWFTWSAFFINVSKFQEYNQKNKKPILKLDKKNTKSLETLNTPIQINNQRGLSKPKYPPSLGEDTKKVLKNILNIDDGEIKKLISLKVIK